MTISKRAKLSLLTAVMLNSFSAQAILFPEGTMPAAEYNDYLVKLEFLRVDGSGHYQGVAANCGGLLVGGEYVITAKHCYEDESGYIRIVQGVDTEDDDKATIVSFGKFSSNEVLAFEADVFEGVYPQMWNNWALDPAAVGVDVINPYAQFLGGDSTMTPLELDAHLNNLRSQDTDYSLLAGPKDFDMAIIKLDQVLPHVDSVQIGKTVVNGLPQYPNGTEMDFYGWGKNADGNLSTILNTMKIELESTWSEPFVFEHRGDYQSDDPSMELKVPVPCHSGVEVDGSGDKVCEFWARPVDLYYAAGNGVGEGDSGTPIVHDGKAIGLVSRDAFVGVNSVRSYFVNFNYTDNWMSYHIGELVFPKVVYKTAEVAGEYTFVVQNFSSEDVPVTLPIGSIASGVEITQGCSLTLSNAESCEVTISYDALGEDEVLLDAYVLDVSDNQFMTLTLSGSELEIENPGLELPGYDTPEFDICDGLEYPTVECPDIEIPVVDVPDVDVDDSDYPTLDVPDNGTPAGGSSGGSFGLFSLLGLALLTLRRKK